MVYQNSSYLNLLAEEFLNVFREKEVPENNLIARHHFGCENQRHRPPDAINERERLQTG